MCFGWDDWNCAPFFWVSSGEISQNLHSPGPSFLASDALFWLPYRLSLPSSLSCFSLTTGTRVITTSYLVHSALCLAPAPWLLRIACPALRLAHLHFWCPAKLMIFVSFPCLAIPAWLPTYKPSPSWVAFNPWLSLLSGALALAPWFLTLRCDSIYVPNATICR